MDILKSLGVDSTLWIQLFCFVVSYVALTRLVFGPYMRAFHERERRTVGNEESAVRIVQEAHEMQTEYEKKARALNTEIKTVYDQSRADALKEYDRLVKEARDQATVLLDQSRVSITQEIQAARKALSAEIPAVSSAIASRLAGKEIKL